MVTLPVTACDNSTNHPNYPISYFVLLKRVKMDVAHINKSWHRLHGCQITFKPSVAWLTWPIFLA